MRKSANKGVQSGFNSICPNCQRCNNCEVVERFKFRDDITREVVDCAFYKSSAKNKSTGK